MKKLFIVLGSVIGLLVILVVATFLKMQDTVTIGTIQSKSTQVESVSSVESQVPKPKAREYVSSNEPSVSSVKNESDESLDRSSLYKGIQRDFKPLLEMMFERLSGPYNPIAKPADLTVAKFSSTSDVYKYMVDPYKKDVDGYEIDVALDFLLYLNRTLPDGQNGGYYSANGDSIKNEESERVFGPVLGDKYELVGNIQFEDVTDLYPNATEPLVAKVTFTYQAGSFKYDTSYLLYVLRDGRILSVSPVKLER